MIRPWTDRRLAEFMKAHLPEAFCDADSRRNVSFVIWGAITAATERRNIELVPFRQIAIVLLTLCAIVGAALFVLSWDSDDGDTAAPGADESPDTASTTTSTTTTTTIAPVTTSIPTDCVDADADEEPTEVAPEDVETTVPAPTTTETTQPADDEPPAPQFPTLSRASSISTVGLDEVTFGLTVNQAERASATTMNPCAPVSDCYRVTPSSAPEGISFVVHEGTIERVDIVGDSPITTVSGAGIGTTREKLDSLFGDRLEAVDLGGGTVDVIFVPADENDQEFRVAFTTVDDVVETLRAGRVPLVLETDPCA